MTNNLPHILVADDDRSIRGMLNAALGLNGFHSTSVSSGREAIEAARQTRFDAVLCDIFMPDGDGLEVTRQLRVIAPEVPILLITAQGSLDLAVQALSEGASDFIAKPFEIASVIELLRRYIASRNESGNLQGQSSVMDDLSRTGLIGRSPEMVKVYKLIAQAARTDATVLLTGESGTGKELVARAIHAFSARAAKAFVAINCSGLTDTLLESELFGHTKGAFTGASADRAGLFEAADGGTILLDELATTTSALQASLLRVLQSGEVRRVGSSMTRSVNVRIIGASNAHLHAMAGEGGFRPDLFYRLSVFNIDLPPLRNRTGDIDLLALHFLTRMSGDEHPPLRMTREASDALRSHSFPGNVRELENALLHAAALAANRLITLDCLPTHIALAAREKRETQSPGTLPNLIADWPTMDELQRRYLELMLARNDGNRSHTAEALGLDRRTVQRMLAKFHLEVEDEESAEC